MPTSSSQPTSVSLFKFVRRLNVGYPRLAWLFVVLLPSLLRLSLLPYFPAPEPEIHDEFSYLLGADTLAMGRLTNPPHPLWVHFETIHVNQQPTYATKYPPGQSMFLALGQKVLGHPWYGVVISVSFMCACLYWMLQGWLPPPYPLLGSLLASAQFGFANYWGNSYWGGAIAAAGGALVIGALPRLARRPRMSAALLGACGAAILANTRPYEGFVFTAASIFVLVWWRWREQRALGPLLAWRVVLPAAIALSLTFIWMGYYNYRVTGKPLQMPYDVNQRAYAANPQFWFMPERQPPPVYRHEVLQRFWSGYLRAYRKVHANPLNIVTQLRREMSFFLPAPLLLSAIIAVYMSRTRKVRFALVIAGAVAGAMLLETMLNAHYFAPATGPILFLVLVGARYIVQVARRFPRTGDYALLLFAGLFLIGFGYKSMQIMRRPPRVDFPVQRREVIRRLVQGGSHHLVVVRYSPDHNVQQEWVYNRADIDHAEIVWARDMGETGNRQLLDYYRDRNIWLLEPDAEPPRLTSYGAEASVIPGEKVSP